MRASLRAILRLTAVAGLLVAAPPARAEDAPKDASKDCDVPAYLLTSDGSLSRVSEAVKAGRRLDILVVGSRSSTIAGSENAAYPMRLQAALSAKLPSIATNVTVELQTTKTAEDVAAVLGKLATDRKPTLVIWQTGTVDAMRSVDSDDFRGSVDDGVVAVQNADADIILINLQYSPRTENMISVVPYLDNMRVVAQQHEVPLFDRFSIMRQWNESGDFDLFSAAHGVELAKRVHDCLGRALSTFVLDTAHINPAELRIQR